MPPIRPSARSSVPAAPTDGQTLNEPLPFPLSATEGESSATTEMRSQRSAASAPSRAGALDRARPGPGHLDVQPEGWGRQDDDHHQSRRGACGVRPQGAPGRLRSAGSLSVGLGLNPPRDGPHDLQRADAERRVSRRRDRASGVPGMDLIPRTSIFCGGGPTRQRGRPRTVPTAHPWRRSFPI